MQGDKIDHRVRVTLIQHGRVDVSGIRLASDEWVRAMQLAQRHFSDIRFRRMIIPGLLSAADTVLAFAAGVPGLIPSVFRHLPMGLDKDMLRAFLFWGEQTGRTPAFMATIVAIKEWNPDFYDEESSRLTSWIFQSAQRLASGEHLLVVGPPLSLEIAVSGISDISFDQIDPLGPLDYIVLSGDPATGLKDVKIVRPDWTTITAATSAKEETR